MLGTFLSRLYPECCHTILRMVYMNHPALKCSSMKGCICVNLSMFGKILFFHHLRFTFILVIFFYTAFHHPQLPVSLFIILQHFSPHFNNCHPPVPSQDNMEFNEMGLGRRKSWGTWRNPFLSSSATTLWIDICRREDREKRTDEGSKLLFLPETGGGATVLTRAHEHARTK